MYVVGAVVAVVVCGALFGGCLVIVGTVVGGGGVVAVAGDLVNGVVVAVVGCLVNGVVGGVVRTVFCELAFVCFRWVSDCIYITTGYIWTH